MLAESHRRLPIQISTWLKMVVMKAEQLIVLKFRRDCNGGAVTQIVHPKQLLA